MATKVRNITPREARARQSEILAELKISATEILERVDEYDFTWDEQILAEEYARLQFLLSGIR